MIKEQEIRNFIDFIEPKFEKLWNTLILMKYYKSNKDLTTELIDFQYELAKCLSTINFEYLKISETKKKLNVIQKTLSKQEYNCQKEELEDCSDALKQLIYLGKSLGDAFAWFFYQNEREMLNKHLDHKAEFLLPSGKLGKIGELEFVRNIKHFGQCFILYHNITNILRISDISLISLPSMKLAGLAELKTRKKEGNLINISMYAFGPKSEKISVLNNAKLKNKPKEENNDSSSYKERLEKQIKTILDSLQIYNNNQEKKEEQVTSGDYITKLVKIINESKEQGKLTYLKASDGMLLSSIRPEGKKLSEKYFETPKKELLANSDFLNIIDNIMDKESKDNGIQIGSIHYGSKGELNVLRGTKPLFWQELPIEIIKQIYFKDILIVTIYNPLFFFKKMEAFGFVYKYNERLKKKCFVKTDPLYNLVIDQVAYIIALIINHLVDEQTVMDSFSVMSERIKKEKLRSNTKVEIEFYQK